MMPKCATNFRGHSKLSQTHCSTRSTISRDRSSRDDRDENDGVHDVGHRLEASITVGNDEGRGVSARTTEEVRVLGRNSDSDHQGTHQIEERKADPDGADGVRDGLLRVLHLRGNET